MDNSIRPRRHSAHDGRTDVHRRRPRDRAAAAHRDRPDRVGPGRRLRRGRLGRHSARRGPVRPAARCRPRRRPALLRRPAARRRRTSRAAAAARRRRRVGRAAAGPAAEGAARAARHGRTRRRHGPSPRVRRARHRPRSGGRPAHRRSRRVAAARSRIGGPGRSRRRRPRLHQRHGCRRAAGQPQRCAHARRRRAADGRIPAGADGLGPGASRVPRRWRRASPAQPPAATAAARGVADGDPAGGADPSGQGAPSGDRARRTPHRRCRSGRVHRQPELPRVRPALAADGARHVPGRPVRRAPQCEGGAGGVRRSAGRCARGHRCRCDGRGGGAAPRPSRRLESAAGGDRPDAAAVGAPTARPRLPVAARRPRRPAGSRRRAGARRPGRRTARGPVGAGDGAAGRGRRRRLRRVATCCLDRRALLARPARRVAQPPASRCRAAGRRWPC